ncbi:conserved hypothetical protein [uncultured Pleomorphomonas sp.]|uniref:T6SS Transcription factor RovC-like DNA binding domain-containing protein n=1 Tax=uncultured Pleomorphomonas sp. TaxID=442121 RepID=A0A212KXW7_9HYPH|nr:DUF2285 domain-containing protein [uncultured Pleomorphomonas sp.]SCM70144.1 conserved hypothetical protein [uncultured Pleomorphomonas sp.]
MPTVGGCDFPADPNLPADRAVLFWTSTLQPDAFELRPSPSSVDDGFAIPLRLPDFPILVGVADEDGAWHGHWWSFGHEHRFRLDAAPPEHPVTYAVILPLDALLELRAEAVLRFWRAVNGRPSGPWHHPLPKQTRDRHVLILRALDAHRTGASYRTIAEVLFGFHGRTKADWEQSELKNRTRRLVADGLRYMRGDYRRLLHYPLRLPRPR